MKLHSKRQPHFSKMVPQVLDNDWSLEDRFGMDNNAYLGLDKSPCICLIVTASCAESGSRPVKRLFALPRIRHYAKQQLAGSYTVPNQPS
jgi:hypothetical protein